MTFERKSYNVLGSIKISDAIFRNQLIPNISPLVLHALSPPPKFS